MGGNKDVICDLHYHSGSVSASQVSLSRGPGAQPLYLSCGEENIVNKTQATVWQTGPLTHKEMVKQASLSGGIGAL